MTAGYAEGPSPGIEPEYGRLVEVLDQHDLLRNAYYQRCYDYAERPTNKTKNELAKAAEAHIAVAYDYLWALMSDVTVAEFAHEATQFVLTTDHHRVAALNASLDHEALKPMKDEFNLSDSDDWSADDEEYANDLKLAIAEHCQKLIRGGVVGDSQEYIRHVGETKTGQHQERKEKLLRHSVDVGKIALGTAAGLLVTQLLRRRP